MQETIICVCLILITLSFISIVVAILYMLMTLRRLSNHTTRIIMQLEKGVDPVLGMMNRVSADITAITATLRLQVEKIALTTDQMNKRMGDLVETCSRTGFLLHDAIVEPLVDIIAFLKGINRGLHVLFNKRRT